MPVQTNDLYLYAQGLHRRLEETQKIIYFSSLDPSSDAETHSLEPGDLVLIQKPLWKRLEEHFEGPYQVLLWTNTANKLEGKSIWVYASHCKMTVVNPRDGACDKEPSSMFNVPNGPLNVMIWPMMNETQQFYNSTGKVLALLTLSSAFSKANTNLSWCLFTLNDCILICCVIKPVTLGLLGRKQIGVF